MGVLLCSGIFWRSPPCVEVFSPASSWTGPLECSGGGHALLSDENLAVGTDSSDARSPTSTAERVAAGRNPNREDALRDFRRQSAKFRKITPAELRTIRDVSGRGNYDDRVPGLVLASQLSGYYVFRTALIAVVLSMAVGRNASLLCQVWCDPALAAASGCHRQSDSTDLPSLVGHGCDDKAPSGALFLKEDMRRSVSAPDSDHAILVLRYQFAPTTTGLPPADEPGHLPSLEKRPLDTALRI